MEIWSDLATITLAAAFAGSGLVICLAGLRVASLADRIADRTGLGEALVGAVLLGAATSLSGIIVSVTSALDGRASLAFANSVGGIAAQTLFLAIADIVYRRSNLEHAAADLGNIFQGVVLMVLLALPFVALTTPEATVWAVHPVSFAIPAVYVVALLSGRAIREAPMWTPVATDATRADVPEPEDAEDRRQSTGRVLAGFLALMLVMAAAGWVVARTAATLTDRMALSETLVGALATAVVTSLPELVTTLAAIRHGALQLAVGGIIGGNTFDTLFLTASDVAYREGSLFHAVPVADYAWIVTALLMTGVLVAGLILRQKQGPAGIGGESVALLAIYAAAVAVQVFVLA
jgi:cation:H+ antiporter